MDAQRPPGTWPDAFLDQLRQHADPEADSVIAALTVNQDAGAVIKTLATLLTNEQPVPGTLPERLERFLADTARLPDSIDAKQLDRAAEVFARWQPQIALVLMCASLPVGYGAYRVSRLLRYTGDMYSDPKRRVMETAQLLFDIFARGGLGPSGRGVRSTQRVRLMHAAIRHHVMTHPGVWMPAWGRPLNQEDLAATLLTFTLIIFDGLARLGVQLSEDDQEAIFQLWRAVGTVLGVEPAALPINLADARAMWTAEVRRQLDEDVAGDPALEAARDDAIQLAAALLEAIDGLAPARFLRPGGREMVRYLSGARAADRVGIRPGSWWSDLIWSGVFRAMAWVDRTLQSTHLADLAAPFSDELLAAFVRIERGEPRPSFSIPRFLQAEWELDALEQGPRVPEQPRSGPILAMTDPLARNHEISRWYYTAARAFAQEIGGPDVNWFAFASWASQTVGAAIQGTAPDIGFRAHIEQSRAKNGEPLLLHAVLREIAIALFPVVDLIFDAMRPLFETMSKQAGIGNRAVFGDVGVAGEAVLQRVRQGTWPDDSELEAIAAVALAGVSGSGSDGSGPARAAGSDHTAAWFVRAFSGASPIVHGFRAYRTAAGTTDRRARTELMLYGNLCIGAHEQAVLQPYIEALMAEPIASKLVERLADEVTRRHGQGPDDAQLELIERVAAALEHDWHLFVTEQLMYYQLPGGSLLPTRPVLPTMAANSPILERPDQFELPELRELLGLIGPLSASGENSVRDWSDYPQRMKYIAAVFRIYQQDAELIADPLPDARAP